MLQQLDGSCNKCSKPATLMCQHCLEIYCCVYCRVMDWSEHKCTCYRVRHFIPIKGMVGSVTNRLPDTPIVTQASNSSSACTTAGFKYTMYQLEVIPIRTDSDVDVFVLDTSQIRIDGYIIAADIKHMLQMTNYMDIVYKYCKSPELKKGYSPKVNEIGLAIYTDDEEWHRVVCMQRNPDRTHLVMLLDFGRIYQVSEQNMLPITKDLMFSANTNLCYVESLTAAHYSAFVETIKVEPIIKCRAVKQMEDKYLLKVHDLEKMIS